MAADMAALRIAWAVFIHVLRRELRTAAGDDLGKLMTVCVGLVLMVGAVLTLWALTSM